MSQTLRFSDTLVSEHCFKCGIHFAMPQDFQNVKLRDRTSFYCPNGHGQHYVGKSDAEKLKEAQDQLARERSWRDQTEASNRALRGVATRRRNELERVKGGVCPVKGCNRTFVNLQRHLAGQHPEYVESHL